MSEHIFEPYPWDLRQLVSHVYQVPVYQRPYSWGLTEVKTLLDDLFDAYDHRIKGTTDGLFTGTLYLRNIGTASNGGCQLFEVVDGQQRLATFSLLLISLFSQCIKRGISKDQLDVANLRSYLWKRPEQDFLKDEPLLRLNSIDRDLFSYIFDQSYESPEGILNAVKTYQPRCSTDENIISVFSYIYQEIEAKIPFDQSPATDVLTFLNFLLGSTQFVIIKTQTDPSKVFSMFEAINSKGKPLEEIDKIKTFIFSAFGKSDSEIYLTKWGQLIIKTDDHLEDYFGAYLRAFITYYKPSVNLVYFKSLSALLPGFFRVQDLCSAFKKLIDDMLDKVDCYVAYLNEQVADKMVNRSAFTFYFKLLKTLHFEHPKPVLVRALVELRDGKISKDDVVSIAKSSVLFMFKFLSISNGDSKDSMSAFKEILEHTYSFGKMDPGFINGIFEQHLLDANVNKETIAQHFIGMNFYAKHELPYAVLCMVESVDSKNRLMFEQASLMLSHVHDDLLEVDHLMPQDPDSANKSLRYFRDNSSGKPVLSLKPGNDFPADLVKNGMPYEKFEAVTLHRIGNLRLYNKHSNIDKGNETFVLPGHIDFVSYQQIVDRAKSFADLLFSCPDLV